MIVINLRLWSVFDARIVGLDTMFIAELEKTAQRDGLTYTAKLTLANGAEYSGKSPSSLVLKVLVKSRCGGTVHVSIDATVHLANLSYIKLRSYE